MWGPTSRSSKPIGNSGMTNLLVGAVIGALTTMMFLLFISSGTYKCQSSVSPSSVSVREDIHLNLDGFDWGNKGFFGSTYMKRRSINPYNPLHSCSNFTYYKSVIRLALQYAPDAQSIIDVGAPFPFVTAFDWIPQKTMLNDRYPEGITTPPDVSLIETDFYKFNPSEKYDLVICNQVMEHVDDPAAFAQKLLSIGKVVIASVPYRWPAKHNFGHKQHNIQHEDFISWFGRTDYSEVGIVNEVQRICGPSCRRVYVVFQPTIPRDKKIFNPTHTTWKDDKANAKKAVDTVAVSTSEEDIEDDG